MVNQNLLNHFVAASNQQRLDPNRVGQPTRDLERRKRDKGMRVLLIEDDSATAQSIELMLKSENFNVYTTDLGEEGCRSRQALRLRYHPSRSQPSDMSGYEVLRNASPVQGEDAILILSGMAGIEDKVRGLGFGADDYMTKPFHRGRTGCPHPRHRSPHPRATPSRSSRPAT